MTTSSPGSHGEGTLAELPTTPSSVVWSEGHAYVLEGHGSRFRWAGLNERGRPQYLTDADLERQGWSRGRR